MFIIDCLPIKQGLKKDSLSYFSGQYIEVGSLIKINVRGKTTKAIVLETRKASEMKAEIKSLNFSLKKIDSVSAKPFLDKNFLEAVKESATYFCSNVGEILFHLLPKSILDKKEILDYSQKDNHFDKDKNEKYEISIIQSPEEERFTFYKSLIRENFAQKKSVFLCLPQNEDIRYIKEKLEKGIEMFVYHFHKDMSLKEIIIKWKECNENSHPVLIIGTAKWLFMPREDIKTIIIDKENSAGWRSLSKPFLDFRFFIEKLAKRKNIRFIIGDSFLTTETLYRYENKEILTKERIEWKLEGINKITIIDFKKTIKENKELRSISDELLDLIKKTIKNKTRIFIFSARKGISPMIFCKDCGEQVKCLNCSSPMSLHKKTNLEKKEDLNVFKCHQCGEVREASEICMYCKSWRLTAYGSGIEKISDEIKKKISGANIFIMQKENSNKKNVMQKMIEDFYAKQGSVLLATEIAFPYLHKKVENSAIASFDSLFSIPDFRIKEKIFKIISSTRNIAKNNFLIQTRNIEDEVVNLAADGDLLKFYKKEMEDRKSLNYPPFGTFIKITIRGTKNFTTKESEKLKEMFNTMGDKNLRIATFNSIYEKKGKKSALNTVINLRNAEWPQIEIINLLKSLPPHFEIKINPDNLL